MFQLYCNCCRLARHYEHEFGERRSLATPSPFKIIHELLGMIPRSG